MIDPIPNKSRVRLDEIQYAHCMKIAGAFMRKHGSIRNRELREAANISYDQAIIFFNRAIVARRLFRKGSGSATHYVLNAK